MTTWARAITGETKAVEIVEKRRHRASRTGDVFLVRDPLDNKTFIALPDELREEN